MLMPAVVVRLLRPPTREVVGRLHDRRARRLDLHRGRRRSTRLAPQFATGMMSQQPPRWTAHSSSRQASAGWRSPLTAAAVGGLDRCRAVVHPPGEQGRPAPGYIRAAAGVVRGGGSWPCTPVWASIDVARFPQVLHAGVSICRWPWWRCLCCANRPCISRCCTKRTTRSSPTSRCCARTAIMSFPIWRSAPRAESPPGRRRGRRARRDVERGRYAATRIRTGHGTPTPTSLATAVTAGTYQRAAGAARIAHARLLRTWGVGHSRGGGWRWSGCR